MAAIPSAPASAHPAGVLTVDDLVRLARQHHPLARMAAIEARAGAGGVRAARAWANPEVDLEAGRARGRGADAEADAIVGRVAIQQPIAWPAERSRRIAAATVAGVAGEAAAALPLLDLEASVRQAALQVIFARKGQALAEAALQATREVLATVARRAAAGEASRGDALRVEIEVARIEQEVAEQASDTAAALAELSSLCGQQLPAGLRLADEIGAPTAPVSGAGRHPRLAHLDTLVRQRQAELAEQRAATVPAFSLGVYGERETDVDAFGVSLGIEVPLWDRNQGGITSASAGVARAEADLAVARSESDLAVARAAGNAAKTDARARRYREQILPKAREALRLAIVTYGGNESTLLDLLDALRTAHAIEAEALAAERDAGLAVLTWHQALGTTLPIREGNAP